MYLRITVHTDDYDPADFPGALCAEHVEHVELVNVFRSCYEFGWELDGTWWITFDGGDSRIESPQWDEWGIVSELPRDGLVYL